MNPATTNLRKRAISLIEKEGLNWRKLAGSAKQIIIFGSQASGLQTPNSDFDLLFVGHGSPHKSRKVHVVWVDEKRLNDPQWLGSELATHVSKYGKWIKGQKPWSSELRPNQAAIRRKRKRIIARVDALEDDWDNLLPKFRRKQLLRLRRDVQRLEQLKKRIPMVPTRLLDIDWRRRRKHGLDWSFFIKNDPVISRKVLAVIKRDASGRISSKRAPLIGRAAK